MDHELKKYDIPMLNDDAASAAFELPDCFLDDAVDSAIQHLSNVWHREGREYNPKCWSYPPEPDEPAVGVRHVLLKQVVRPPHFTLHPLTEWCVASGSNYGWMWVFAVVANEILARTRGITHRTQTLEALEVMPPPLLFTCLTPTPPPTPVFSDAKTSAEIVKAWRKYMVEERQDDLRWSNRTKPCWLEYSGIEGLYKLL
jgi:hypothetical protein